MTKSVKVSQAAPGVRGCISVSVCRPLFEMYEDTVGVLIHLKAEECSYISKHGHDLGVLIHLFGFRSLREQAASTIPPAPARILSSKRHSMHSLVTFRATHTPSQTASKLQRPLLLRTPSPPQSLTPPPPQYLSSPPRLRLPARWGWQMRECRPEHTCDRGLLYIIIAYNGKS